MPTAWRIVKQKHAASAFSGKGAAEVGGRWNSHGVAVVYASNSRALAALELLVHLEPPVPFKYVIFPIHFDKRLLKIIDLATLPADWKTDISSLSTRALGDKWVSDSASPVLEVPSVLIPGEMNFVLNPNHPHFAKIEIGKPEPFAFDPRLVK